MLPTKVNYDRLRQIQSCWEDAESLTRRVSFELGKHLMAAGAHDRLVRLKEIDDCIADHDIVRALDDLLSLAGQYRAADIGVIFWHYAAHAGLCILKAQS